MKFTEAVWYLKANGVRIEPSKKRNLRGRFFKVWDPTSDVPPMWCPAKVICSLAEMSKLAESLTEENPDENRPEVCFP